MQVWASRNFCAGIRVLALLVTFIIGVRSQAEELPRLEQYRHRIWRAGEGLFEGLPRVVRQGADGYMWVGTESGVFRFDGVRFQSFDPPPHHKPFGYIWALFVDRDRSMWIASESGLSVWKDGQLADVAPLGGTVTSIFQDRDGALWVTRSAVADKSGAVCKVEDTHLKCFGPKDGLHLPFAWRLVQDHEGYFWVGGNVLARWKPGVEEVEYFTDQLKAFGTGWGVHALMVDEDGSVFAGLAVQGRHAGLQRFANGKWSTFEVSGFDGGAQSAESLLRDRDHALWVSPLNGDGVVRLSNGRVERYGPPQGLTGATVNSFAQDAEGSIWVSTIKGLDSFSQLPAYNYPGPDGGKVGANVVLGLRDGSLFLGCSKPLILKDGVYSEVGLPAGSDASANTNAVLEDSAGRLWIARYNSVYLSDHGRPTVIRDVNREDHLALGDIVKSIAEDSTGKIWAMIEGRAVSRIVQLTPHGVMNVQETSRRARSRWLVADRAGGMWLSGASDQLFHLTPSGTVSFTIPQRSPGLLVREMFEGTGDALYLSTNQGFMVREDGQWKTIDARNGLPYDAVDAAMLGKDNSLWLATRRGLLHFGDGEWQRALHFPGTMLKFEVFDALRGWLPSLSIASPKMTRTVDGRLWFVSEDGMQMLDPVHLHKNDAVPQVAIERVNIDRRDISPEEHQKGLKKPRDIEIDYTALSFAEPRLMRFRYRLLGRDDRWQDPGLRRQAFFSDLSPGRYSFQVIASNNDGVWNSTGAWYSFVVLPGFYQTWWFRSLCAIAFVLVLWGLYAMRVRTITHQLALQNRERESVARDLHDTFFQTVQSLFLRFHTAISSMPLTEDNAIARAAMLSTLLDSDRVMLQGREMFLEPLTQRSEKLTFEEMVEAAAVELALAHPIPYKLVRTGTIQKLKPLVLSQVYKIAREAMYNAFRHSQATLIVITIDSGPRQFCLSVVDDGVGFDTALLEALEGQGHWGFTNMRQRAAGIAATLTIRSTPSRGVQIELILPAARAYDPDARADPFGSA